MPNIKTYTHLTSNEADPVHRAIIHILQIAAKSQNVAAAYGFNREDIDCLKSVAKRIEKMETNDYGTN